MYKSFIYKDLFLTIDRLNIEDLSNIPTILFSKMPF
jgi:hypothetical protein